MRKWKKHACIKMDQGYFLVIPEIMFVGLTPSIYNLCISVRFYVIQFKQNFIDFWLYYINRKFQDLYIINVEILGKKT